MPDDQFTIAPLLSRYLTNGDMTPAEKEVVESWLDQSTANRDLIRRFENDDWFAARMEQYLRIDAVRSWKRLQEKMPVLASINYDGSPAETSPPVEVVKNAPWRDFTLESLRMSRAWQRGLSWVTGIASVAILAVGGDRLLSPARQKVLTARSHSRLTPAVKDANLHLATGPEVQLADKISGLLATIDCVDFTKTDSQLVLLPNVKDCGNPVPARPRRNRLSTPIGGWFSLSMTDGSRINLNAASVLLFPTVFVGEQRDVILEGEGYFAIAPDTGMNSRPKPFVVHVPTHLGRGQTPTDTGMLNIVSLGTKFNVKAYAEDSIIRTTLDEGNIRLEMDGKVLLLKAGQAAVLDETGTLRRVDRDSSDTGTVQNGLFTFKQQPAEFILRDLARWYGATIVYTGERPTMRYTLNGWRQQPFRALLDQLVKMGGIRYTIHADTVLVSR